MTGGAGFIGSHVVDLLIDVGHNVTILDSLVEQVHGKSRTPPPYLNSRAKLVTGEVADRKLLSTLLNSSDAVIHFASKVGIGQSMYRIEEYIDANTKSTATLLDVMANERTPVSKLIVASSMSVYGEGKYVCRRCEQQYYPKSRSEEALKEARLEFLCPVCGDTLTNLPTDEESILQPTSIYAMSKRHQEETCLLIGQTYGISTVALRFFNVYGPRQALSNPYTGVCAIFTGRILNRKQPFVFEDGNQLRDFVHVRDAARACLLALEQKNADNMPLNIGTGSGISILEIAQTLAGLLGVDLKPQISQQYRKGDIRHCYADISKARKLLGYSPQVNIREGLMELTDWAKNAGWETVDLFEQAMRELEQRKLT